MKRLISCLLVLITILSFIPAIACADSGYVDPDAAAKAATEAYKKSLDSYKYTIYSMSGNGKWDSEKESTEKEPNNFRFSCTGPYTGFDVFIDGKKIPWDEYISWADEKGSTFEIDNSYMSGLTVGKHRLSVWYIDGYRGANYFEVLGKEEAK